MNALYTITLTYLHECLGRPDQDPLLLRGEAGVHVTHALACDFHLVRVAGGDILRCVMRSSGQRSSTYSSPA